VPASMQIVNNGAKYIPALKKITYDESGNSSVVAGATLRR